MCADAMIPDSSNQDNPAHQVENEWFAALPVLKWLTGGDS